MTPAPALGAEKRRFSACGCCTARPLGWEAQFNEPEFMARLWPPRGYAILGPMTTRGIAFIVLSAALLTSCCLDVGSESMSPGTGSAGSGATTGSTRGFDSGPQQVGCAGVYCAPFYACDPFDGLCKCGGTLCKCGGTLCNSGHCGASSETCLPGCPTDGGTGDLLLTLGPDPDYPLPPPGSSNALVLPAALVGKTYAVQLNAFCGTMPWLFTPLSPLPSGLNFYPQGGQIEGAPTTPTQGAPFEFEIEVQDARGAVAFQNFLIQIGAGN